MVRKVTTYGFFRPSASFVVYQITR
jgi:hypothetical protein